MVLKLEHPKPPSNTPTSDDSDSSDSGQSQLQGSEHGARKVQVLQFIFACISQVFQTYFQRCPESELYTYSAIFNYY